MVDANVNIKKDDATAKGLMDKARRAQEYAQQTNVVKGNVAQFAEDVNKKNQERYSTRDQTDAVSVREYLSGMKPQSYMNGTEKALLQRYQDKLKDLQEKQQAVAEQDETMAMQGEEQAGENVEKVDESRKVQYAIRDTPAESVTTIAP